MSVDKIVDAAAMRAMIKDAANNNDSAIAVELKGMFEDMVKHRPIKVNPATYDAKGEKL